MNAYIDNKQVANTFFEIVSLVVMYALDLLTGDWGKALDVYHYVPCM